VLYCAGRERGGGRRNNKTMKEKIGDEASTITERKRVLRRRRFLLQKEKGGAACPPKASCPERKKKEGEKKNQKAQTGKAPRRARPFRKGSTALHGCFEKRRSPINRGRGGAMRNETRLLSGPDFSEKYEEKEGRMPPVFSENEGGEKETAKKGGCETIPILFREGGGETRLYNFQGGERSVATTQGKGKNANQTYFFTKEGATHPRRKKGKEKRQLTIREKNPEEDCWWPKFWKRKESIGDQFRAGKRTRNSPFRGKIFIFSAERP